MQRSGVWDRGHRFELVEGYIQHQSLRGSPSAVDRRSVNARSCGNVGDQDVFAAAFGDQLRDGTPNGLRGTSGTTTGAMSSGFLCHVPILTRSQLHQAGIGRSILKCNCSRSSARAAAVLAAWPSVES